MACVFTVPPKILGKGDSDITVLKGEKVILNCENTGDPTPTVDWKKDETVLSVFGDSDGFEETDEGLLVIESARVFHTGRYVCVVENDAGLTTRDFVLRVQGKLQILRLSSSVGLVCIQIAVEIWSLKNGDSCS